MAGIVVLFNFDRTINDDESPGWVAMAMALAQLSEDAEDVIDTVIALCQLSGQAEQLIDTWPGDFRIDNLMMELHKNDRTIWEMRSCFRSVQMNPRIVAAIEAAHASGCDLRVISHANRFFIQTILEHNKLLEHFSEIYTNPTTEDEEGRLWITPHHRGKYHGCLLCPPSMCKGLVIERMKSDAADGKKNIIYIGDGKGDMCLRKKLGPEDYVMDRRNFPELGRTGSKPGSIKAEVVALDNEQELAKALLQLIGKISTEEDINNITSS